MRFQKYRFTAKRIILSLSLIAIVLATALSCALTGEALVEPDGSGTGTFYFEVQPFFRQAVEDMSDLMEEETMKDDIFASAKIREDFNQNPNIDLDRLELKGQDILIGEFRFPNLKDLMTHKPELIESGVIAYRPRGSGYEIDIHVSRENIEQIYRVLHLDGNPLVDMFGPHANEATTEAEYLEMMEFVLGEDGPSGIKSSVIELKVSIQGRILSQTGGTQIGNSVVYQIPLIEALLLEEPLNYSLVFE